MFEESMTCHRLIVPKGGHERAEQLEEQGLQAKRVATP